MPRASLARRAAALEHADSDYQSALEAVAGSGGAVDDVHVAAAAAKLGRRRELREVEQARTAGRSALQGLLAAQETLSRAGSWSAWDTFGGGGVLSSTMKHERLDDARQRLEVAGDALARFTAELDDLRMPAISLPGFSGLVRGMDIWWDNLAVDLLVGEQIRSAQRNVDAAAAGSAKRSRCSRAGAPSWSGDGFAGDAHTAHGLRHVPRPPVSEGGTRHTAGMRQWRLRPTSTTRQPRSRASSRSSRSGLTATAVPTRSIIGRSLMESL